MTKFYKFSRNRGFTLIELIVVIVVIGILAVVAAPKFIDVSSDARAAVIESLAGTLRSQEDIIRAKASIPGSLLSGGNQQILDMNRNGIVDIEPSLSTTGDLSGNDGVDIMMINGNASLNIDNHQIHKLVSLSEEIIPIGRSDQRNTDIGFDLDGDGEVRDDNCRVFYSQVSSAIVAVTSGC